jgi:hypothetical protein
MDAIVGDPMHGHQFDDSEMIHISNHIPFFMNHIEKETRNPIVEEYYNRKQINSNSNNNNNNSSNSRNHFHVLGQLDPLLQIQGMNCTDFFIMMQ